MTFGIDIDVEFEEGLLYWQQTDKKIASKICALVDSIIQNPFDGIGKPEPLKYEFSGCWSRRINKEHRVIYRIFNNRVQLISCRYHY